MEIRQPQKRAVGSFGMPPEMQENLRRHQESKEVKKDAPPPVVDEDAAAPAPIVDEAVVEEEKTDPLTPILKNLGIEITDADVESMIFKGSISKEIMLVNLAKRPLKGTFRTVTADEWEQIDELWMEEAKDKLISHEGLDNRRSMWVMSYAVTHLNGNPLSKPIYLEGTKELDSRAMARQRHKALKNLDAMLINKIVKTQSAFAMAMRMMMENPDGNFTNAP